MTYSYMICRRSVARRIQYALEKSSDGGGAVLRVIFGVSVQTKGVLLPFQANCSHVLGTTRSDSKQFVHKRETAALKGSIRGMACVCV